MSPMLRLYTGRYSALRLVWNLLSRTEDPSADRQFATSTHEISHFMLKLFKAPTAISFGRFSGRQCRLSRLPTTAMLGPHTPLLTQQQPQHQLPQQQGTPTQLPSSFDASKVTPPYRTKELEGLKGIEGMGASSVGSLQGIGISSKGELLYLHKVMCGGDMGATKAFLKVSSGLLHLCDMISFCAQLLIVAVVTQPCTTDHAPWASP